jgi:hypothetical protein
VDYYRRLLAGDTMPGLTAQEVEEAKVIWSVPIVYGFSDKLA